MQTETAVRKAKSPQDALLAVAQGIDRIQALVLGRSDDAWFSDWPADLVAPTSGAADEALRVREQLAHATGEEAMALQAKLRLLEDKGAPPVDPVTEGRRAEIEYEDGQIVLPPASVDRQLRRRSWLFENIDVLLSFYPGGVMTREMLTEGYIKGGPLWLYYQDNRKLLEMPAAWRHEFVADIGEDSQAAAQEIGRDLLKDAAPISPGEAVEALSA